MSAYFDRMQMEAANLRTYGEVEGPPKLREFELRVFETIAIACEFERSSEYAIPAELRDRAYTCLLRGSMAVWDGIHPYHGPDYASFEQGVRIVERMISDLHTVFHDIARAVGPGFDNPAITLNVLCSRAEERMQTLVDIAIQRQS